MLAFALWRRLLAHEMLVRINKTTTGPPSVYKRVMPNGGHQALRAKKPCSTRGPKPEVQTCPVQGFSASPNPRCGLLLPQSAPWHRPQRPYCWYGQSNMGREPSALFPR
jgi:hypothetical protein